MKNALAQTVLLACKVQPHHIRLMLMLLAITMFVIGVGAPESGGSIGE